MKRLFILSTFFLLTNSLLLGQDTDMLIKDIQFKYNEIRTNLDSCDTTMIQIWDESTEGGQASAYYDNGTLKLITVVWLNETSKKQIEYYFSEGQLFFAFEQNFNYNRPIYWDKETAKENGDDDFFDSNKTTVKEDRYYFNHEKLFLWLGPNRQEQDLTRDINSQVGQRLISHCYKLKDELRK